MQNIPVYTHTHSTHHRLHGTHIHKYVHMHPHAHKHAHLFTTCSKYVQIYAPKPNPQPPTLCWDTTVPPCSHVHALIAQWRVTAHGKEQNNTSCLRHPRTDRAVRYGKLSLHFGDCIDEGWLGGWAAVVMTQSDMVRSSSHTSLQQLLSSFSTTKKFGWIQVKWFSVVAAWAGRILHQKCASQNSPGLIITSSHDHRLSWLKLCGLGLVFHSQWGPKKTDERQTLVPEWFSSFPKMW